MTKLNSQGLEELVRQFEKFFAATPEDRGDPPLGGTANQMCEEGKQLFDRFCKQPQPNDAFLVHYDPKLGNCTICRSAFLKHLFFFD